MDEEKKKKGRELRKKKIRQPERPSAVSTETNRLEVGTFAPNSRIVAQNQRALSASPAGTAKGAATAPLKHHKLYRHGCDDEWESWYYPRIWSANDGVQTWALVSGEREYGF